jgi:hypothetical protein
MAATIAISTRLIAFMFSLALSAVNLADHRVVGRAGEYAYTTHDASVTRATNEKVHMFFLRFAHR